jgi:hypothetical protein
VRRSRPNPAGISSISTESWILIGLGTALLGAVFYGIYEISEAKDVLASTNDTISGATDAANNVGNQIGAAIPVAQNVGDQIGATNTTIQQQSQSSLVQAAQSAAAWWQSL